MSHYQNLVAQHDICIKQLTYLADCVGLQYGVDTNDVIYDKLDSTKAYMFTSLLEYLTSVTEALDDED